MDRHASSPGIVACRGPSRRLLLATACMLSAVVVGCVLTDKQLDPSLEVPRKYRYATSTTNAEPPSLEWWRSFHSAELTDLMQQSIPANFDIAVAVAQIVEADAQARIASAPLLPTFSGTFSASTSQSSRGGGAAVTSGGVATSSGGVATTSGGVATTSGGVATTSGGVATSSGGVATSSGGVATSSGGVANSSGGVATTSGGVATTSGGAGGASSGGGPVGLFSTAVNASYTLDFWGRFRDLLQAAEENAVVARFARDVVTLTTLVSVADTYFTVLENQDLLAVTRKNLAAFETILKLIQDRFAQGTAAALDVAQQASLVAIQRADIPPLIEQIELNSAALALLVGRAPSNFTVRGGSMFKLAIPRVRPGLPSQLLVRRPDIREAEAQLAGANANVAAARAAFFPTITLTGEAGFESTALKTLFGPGAAMYSLASNITQPIFEGGQLLGQLDLEQGLREQFLQSYRKSVINAFTNVEQALVAVQQTTRQEALQRDAVKEAQRAYDLSLDKLHQGTIDMTTLLTIEETLFSTEITLDQVRFARLEAIVSLYQALGGGWLKDDMTKERLPPIVN